MVSTSTLRIIWALALIGHGIGHGMGILAAAGIKLSDTHSAESRLLKVLPGSAFSQTLSIVIWSLAIVGFVLAGMGLAGWLVPREWWQPLARAAAIISLVGLVFFWDAFPFFFPNKIGVIIVDCGVILSLSWLKWPAAIVTN